MIQTTRFNCFETNSSSYHSLSIHKKSAEKPKCEIIPGKDIIISSKIDIRHIGYTESYSYVAKNSYEKAQLILRFIGGELEEQVDKLISEDEWKNGSNDFRQYDWDKRYILRAERVYQTPIMCAYINAIKKYIGDYEVKVELNKSGLPEQVYDSNQGLSDVLMINDDDLENVELLTDKFYEYIFNDDYEITEECESNE